MSSDKGDKYVVSNHEFHTTISMVAGVLTVETDQSDPGGPLVFKFYV